MGRIWLQALQGNCGVPRRGVFFHPENHFLDFWSKKPSRATAAFLAGAFFFTQKTTFGDFQVCGRRAGRWHAGARESLSLLLSLHSLHISHTQNRYPALRGENATLPFGGKVFVAKRQPLAVKFFQTGRPTVASEDPVDGVVLGLQKGCTAVVL